MQRRLADGDAAHEYRVKDGVRVQTSRPPDVDPDLQEPGRRLLGRELPRGRPPWVAPDRPEPGLQSEIVHLDHDPVDAVVQFRANSQRVFKYCAYLIEVNCDTRPRVGLEAPTFEGVKNARLRRRDVAVGDRYRVDEGVKRA